MKIDILIGMILMGMAVAAPIDKIKADTSSTPALNRPNDIAQTLPGTPASGQFNTYVINPSEVGLSLENLRVLQALLGNQSPQSGNTLVSSGLLPTKSDKLNPTTIFQLYQPVININHNYIVQPGVKIPNQAQEKPSDDKNSMSPTVTVSDEESKDSQMSRVTSVNESRIQDSSSTESSLLPEEPTIPSTTPTSLINAIEQAKVNLLNYLLFGYNRDLPYPKPR